MGKGMNYMGFYLPMGGSEASGDDEFGIEDDYEIKKKKKKRKRRKIFKSKLRRYYGRE
jgi:hypothetical protein